MPVRADEQSLCCLASRGCLGCRGCLAQGPTLFCGWSALLTYGRRGIKAQPLALTGDHCEGPSQLQNSLEGRLMPLGRLRGS